MSHKDEQTLISPEIKKDHRSKSKDITIMDYQTQKEKDPDTRPHYRATTKAEKMGHLSEEHQPDPSTLIEPHRLATDN